MDFECTIRSESKALKDDPYGEMRSILTKLAERVSSGCDEDHGAIYDSNNVRVGDWEMKIPAGPA